MRGSRTGLAPVAPLALVCTDGQRTVVAGDTDTAAALRGVPWATDSDPAQVLIDGLQGGVYVVTEGPISWDDVDPAAAAQVLARAYGL